MKKVECGHQFEATPEKGAWKVRAFGTNNRGRISIENVSTTVFRCGKCGEKKEFPDTWEWNFLAPGKSRKTLISEKRAEKKGPRKKAG